jgi:hypothetical protein
MFVVFELVYFVGLKYGIFQLLFISFHPNKFSMILPLAVLTFCVIKFIVVKYKTVV